MGGGGARRVEHPPKNKLGSILFWGQHYVREVVIASPGRLPEPDRVSILAGTFRSYIIQQVTHGER